MNHITDISQLDADRVYTYADYLTWRLNERVELINGKIFRMFPALPDEVKAGSGRERSRTPSSEHQRIVSALHGNIYPYIKNKKCRIFPAPFDVVLPSRSGDLDTVVQPDITVICDLSKITEKGCMGAPDLVVEVVSKGSIRKDLHEKFSLYEQSGVKEYWLVLPAERSLILFTLDDKGTYQPAKPLTRGDKVISQVLPGLEIDLDEIFPELVEEPEEGYGSEVRRL